MVDAAQVISCLSFGEQALSQGAMNVVLGCRELLGKFFVAFLCFRPEFGFGFGEMFRILIGFLQCEFRPSQVAPRQAQSECFQPADLCVAVLSIGDDDVQSAVAVEVAGAGLRGIVLPRDGLIAPGFRHAVRDPLLACPQVLEPEVAANHIRVAIAIDVPRAET